ncbi:hypothetical protein LshimejAT787_0308960 [Lyophyllum shimeji]|uniref:Uncharacterized protein n=1 Tax=Lyophyllum shimeji TaxID=47721 RepID=A0A9P3UKF3_LYOSH|nr:hypothetical protein LshimejAT787_0308960 [Lyophyllum shimeji]
MASIYHPKHNLRTAQVREDRFRSVFYASVRRPKTSFSYTPQLPQGWSIQVPHTDISTYGTLSFLINQISSSPQPCLSDKAASLHAAR